MTEYSFFFVCILSSWTILVS